MLCYGGFSGCQWEWFSHRLGDAKLISCGLWYAPKCSRRLDWNSRDDDDG